MFGIKKKNKKNVMFMLSRERKHCSRYVRAVSDSKLRKP